MDHLVLTVASVDASVAFYTRVLGFSKVTVGAGRTGLSFGSQRINLHPLGSAIEPRALRPTPGSADLCFIGATPIERFIADLNVCGVAIVEGPVPRTGALGPMTSVYFRDPDGNLIEVARYELHPISVDRRPDRVSVPGHGT